MRALIALILWLVFGAAVGAQEYRISASGCVRPGGSLAITGSFSGRVGEILLVDGATAVTATVRGWSSTRIRLAVPRSVAPGPQAVVWRLTAAAGPGDRGWIPLGTVQVCPAGARPDRPERDVVKAPGGGAEYVVSVAPREAAAATQVLQGEEAVLLRTTPLPRLNRVLLFVRFPAAVRLGEVRDRLEDAAPSARIDLHHIYSLAEGPRLYAASLIGDEPGRTCALRSPVAVGIIDGPINRSHPALAGVETVETSVLDPDVRPVARDHGTAVAALIAGRQAAFQGFAPGARIYAATAFSARNGGTARLEAVALGLDWMAAQGVRIVNLSMEGSPNAAFEDILTAGRAAGLVMVAAAGNEGTDAPRYPAASAQVIAVTAVDAAGRAYAQANTGPHIDLAAPGVDVYVARGGGGGYRSGTSYAAPIVAGLIARLADRGALSFDGALTALTRSAADLGPAGRDPQFGHGLVQTGGC